jgi:hypothetical protein
LRNSLRELTCGVFCVIAEIFDVAVRHASLA